MRILRALVPVAALALALTLGASPVASDDRLPPAAARPTVRLLFIGASVTSGWFAQDRAHAFPELVASRLRAAGWNTELHVIARPGATAEAARGWNLAVPGDAVVVHLVTNDVGAATPLPAYEAAYADVIARVREVSPRARLVCLGGWDDPASVNRDGIAAQRYDQVVSAVCGANGGTYVDLSAMYLQRADHGPPGAATAMGLRDSFHPNDRGHAQLAAAVLRALALPPVRAPRPA